MRLPLLQLKPGALMPVRPGGVIFQVEGVRILAGDPFFQRLPQFWQRAGGCGEPDRQIIAPIPARQNWRALRRLVRAHFGRQHEGKFVRPRPDELPDDLLIPHHFPRPQRHGCLGGRGIAGQSLGGGVPRQQGGQDQESGHWAAVR